MKSFNKVNLKGRLFSYALEEKDTDKGTAIAGTITVEVAEDGTKVDTRFFAYPTYNSGKPNKTYKVLADILAGNCETVVDDGDEAAWIEVNASIDSDYYVGRDGAESIDDLARSQKVRGAFINMSKDHKYENSWQCDMLITKITELDEDPEKGYIHKVKVFGYYIDSYNERLMGVEFEAHEDVSMNYLLALTASHDCPLYTAIKGEFKKITTSKVIEGAFGGDKKTEYDNLFWIVNWMPRATYDFGDDISLDDYKAYFDALEDYKKDKLNKANAEAEDNNLVF